MVPEKLSSIIVGPLIHLDPYQPAAAQFTIYNTNSYQYSAYALLKMGKESGSILAYFGKKSHSPYCMISLRDKGKKVAKHLKEIEEILSEE